MPASKPPNPAMATKPTPPPKKNTVDYIASKLSYDTAIPVSIFDDRSEFIERCKPYDIIDGPNPLDDVHDETEYVNTVQTLGPIKAGESGVKNDKGVAGTATSTSSTRSSRKRSRSPVKGGSRASSVKGESEDEKESSSSALCFTRPSRDGWAAEQLREGRPYQLLRSRDMETRVRYLLDDCDYNWCAAQNLSAEVVQRGITYLEWAYVSSLLTAATPHVEGQDMLVAEESLSPLGSSFAGSAAGENGSSSAFHSSNVSGHGTGKGCVASGESNDAVSSPTAAAITRLSRSRQQSEREKHAATANASAFACALCSKSVQLLAQEHDSSETAPEGSTRAAAGRSRGGAVAGSRGRGGRGKGSAAASSSAGVSPSVGRARSRGALGLHVSTTNPPTGNSGGTSSGSGAFPSYDLQHQGLRCCECGVVAHLRCWFLTGPPRLPETWTCDGCTNYAQHRKRSAGVCCMCGRMGGVLLPYVSSAAALRDDGDNGGGGTSGSTDPSSPLQAQLHHHHHHSSGAGGFNSTPVAQSDMVCHAVCALTMPELAIQPKSTVLRRNGLVDMEERPYVYALRRVGKQRYAMHCVFCEHGGTGRCVQCHHPHCFEAMHASCAAEAHTVDCHTTNVAASPSSFVPHGGKDPHGLSLADAMSGPSSPGGFASASSTAKTAAGALTGSGGPALCWSSCSTYCRKHYGYSVSNAVGSAALGDKAEAEALALDLTGLLTGGDGITSPVVQKRGRGRPPVALVQQREAERELIQRLHAYWVERREQRRRASGQLVSEINARLRPVVEAALRPEIVKVSADKVRLSHFLSLVPEWQWQLVAIVEGELPLPDEEYDDVQKYRKVAHTRRSGNTRSLYDRMSVASTQLELMCRLTASMKQACRLRRASAELEVDSLRKLCNWKS